MRIRNISGGISFAGCLVVFALSVALCITAVSCIDYYEPVGKQTVLASVRLSDISRTLYASDTSHGGDITSYRFCMKPCFESSGHIENPSSGNTPDGSDAYSSTVWTSVEISEGTGVLGYCTQGCWDVWVRGFNSYGNAIFEGKTQNVYIGSDSGDVSVNLNRAFGIVDEDGKENASKAVLNVSCNAVKVSDSTSMKISIKRTSSSVWSSEASMSRDTSYSEYGRESFSYTDEELEPGMYMAKIAYIDSDTAVSSQVVSFIAYAGNTVDISGSLDAGLYVNEGLSVTVQGNLSVSISKGTGDDEGLYVCTASGPEGGTYSYFWFINGSESESVSQSPEKIQFPGSFTAKGVYDITCVVSWSDGLGDSALSSASLQVII